MVEMYNDVKGTAITASKMPGRLEAYPTGRRAVARGVGFQPALIYRTALTDDRVCCYQIGDGGTIRETCPRTGACPVAARRRVRRRGDCADRDRRGFAPSRSAAGRQTVSSG